MGRPRLMLAGLVAGILLLAGCHFPQGWHWPRLASNGSTTLQTLVYFQNDLVGYQGPLVSNLAHTLSGQPEITVRMVDTCPANVNCIVWRTANINGGLTSVSVNSARHLVAATVTLSTTVGNGSSAYDTVNIPWHEACHAFGGGFGDDPVHRMCNYEHRAHHYEEITRVYHDDPG